MATGDGHADVGSTDQTWRRPTAFGSHRLKWAVYIGATLFVLWSLVSLLSGVSLGRVLTGVNNGVLLLEAMVPPNTASENVDRVVGYMGETIAMAFVATFTGVLISVPIAFGAAENIAPRPIYYLNRGIISITRAIDELIIAIIAVKAVGVGPLAGIIAISYLTIGFFSKLFAEDIEDIDMGAKEAIDATGASRFQTLVYAVIPQVAPRFIGLTVYRWDINIRSSTIIGIVGAGGIGTLLLRAFERYEFDFAALILLSIIAVVLAGELFSAYIRRRVQ
ncbi:ABC-type transport system permease protein (probable substrate phosphate/phosphonate) [Natrialba magadii ATCC 43099]|uniref:ABC-type transport system permease protein (Probable substrate phosphate/phosphonate) n=1 Tax=Natrialba magadii (strain ATCC 43099 / DSM 3394 / CCM 3739 / CIP 104546 / IAM 13178 / JCM 8861 / NBRC 102185 / NCIMB 2190 / MS3) TaxID=547559 RepID=D3SXI1_NATMM|nr:phosphonate ABC transporter, permease protein PhnE [Natrialba magadii]ADD05930.1 ABC-type transport system permease protein (probable substrate phosphate/phosphonate) [Natrialba magadii ATCC 43099]ELY30563.1 phosphonate ABC transporter permease [Natrialba magadii ATCC 43099]